MPAFEQTDLCEGHPATAALRGLEDIAGPAVVDVGERETHGRLLLLEEPPALHHVCRADPLGPPPGRVVVVDLGPEPQAARPQRRVVGGGGWDRRQHARAALPRPGRGPTLAGLGVEDVLDRRLYLQLSADNGLQDREQDPPAAAAVAASAAASAAAAAAHPRRVPVLSRRRRRRVLEPRGRPAANKPRA